MSTRASRTKYVWVEGDRLYAVMPALILYSSEFKPMWREKTANISTVPCFDIFCRHGNTVTIVSIKKPEVPVIIRVRPEKRRDRRNPAKYYRYDSSSDTVTPLRSRLVKKLGENKWMECIELNGYMCFEWKTRNDKPALVVATK